MSEQVQRVSSDDTRLNGAITSVSRIVGQGVNVFDTGNVGPKTYFRKNKHAAARIFARGLNSANPVTVEFPAMPEVVELAREAEYHVVNTWSLPDGIHVYKRTTPVIIPIEFSLNAFDDEYCTDGALTLLKLAASLHYFVSPIFNVENVTSALVSDNGATLASGALNEERQVQITATNQQFNRPSQLPPVSCVLDLIATREYTGVYVFGYLSRVSAKLKGPWLQPSDGIGKNLPSNATYSFDFVVAPNHTNILGTANNFNLSADYINQHLYDQTQAQGSREQRTAGSLAETQSKSFRPLE